MAHLLPVPHGALLKSPHLALYGEGGHSVHGKEGAEGNAHRSMVVDRFGLLMVRDEQKVPKTPRLDCI